MIPVTIQTQTICLSNYVCIQDCLFSLSLSCSVSTVFQDAKTIRHFKYTFYTVGKFFCQTGVSVIM